METQVDQVCGKIDNLIKRIDDAVKNGNVQIAASYEGGFLQRSWRHFLDKYDWVVWLLLGWAMIKWLGFGEAPKNLLRLFGIS